ncbi:HEAT repeat domain-containing protein [Quadrisphaera granulorum]|nr:HEAT repeat domain-containing protein [Quadrisphaera granulorum]
MEAVAAALASTHVSVRLRAAMALGTHPMPELLEVLMERCAAEPDPFVRDTLTWALTRLPADLTLPRLRRELFSAYPQARAQALHTLSKVGAAEAYPWITLDLVSDDDDDVARAAWRAVAALAPEAERGAAAELLAQQLGRGDDDVKRSLSRTMLRLAPEVEPVLERSATSPRPEVAEHATAALLLLRRPEVAFAADIAVADRATALGREKTAALHASADPDGEEPADNGES